MAGQSTTTNGSNETSMLLFAEPGMGVSYKFRAISRKVFPHIEIGGKYIHAKLKNNTGSNQINSTSTAYGSYAAAGINIKIHRIDLVIEATYSYIPIEFDEVKDNIGGPGLFAKVAFGF